MKYKPEGVDKLTFTKDLNSLFLYIPHSSYYLPEEFYKNLNLTEDQVKENLEYFTDYKSKELFTYYDYFFNYNEAIFKYASIFVDPMKRKSELTQNARGCIITKDLIGRKIHSCLDNTYLEFANNIYDDYSNEVDEKINDILNKTNKLLFISCHTFHEKMYIDYCFPNSKEVYDYKLTMFLKKHHQVDITICYNDDDLYSEELAHDAFCFLYTFLGKECSIQLNYPVSKVAIPKGYKKDINRPAAFLEFHFNRIFVAKDKNIQFIAEMIHELYCFLLKMMDDEKILNKWKEQFKKDC